MGKSNEDEGRQQADLLHWHAALSWVVLMDSGISRPGIPVTVRSTYGVPASQNLGFSSRYATPSFSGWLRGGASNGQNIGHVDGDN